MDSTNSILNKVTSILKNGSKNDKVVLEHVLNGLQEKQNDQYNTYITSFMQSSITENDQGLTMTIPITPFLNNSIDIVHGGFTATLADTAMGTLVNKKTSKERVAVTSEMKINYTAPGVGESLECKAEILHLGTRTAVTEAKIYNERGTLVAAASGSFFLVHRKKG